MITRAISEFVMLTGIVLSFGCGPLAPDHHIFRTEVVVEQDALDLAESIPAALLLVIENESYSSARQLACFQEQLFTRPSHRELLPHDGGEVTATGSGYGEGCDPPYEIRAELWTVADSSNCDGLNYTDVEDLDDIERGERVASVSDLVSAEESVCFNRAVESYGTPIIGPLDIPTAGELRIDASSIE